MMYAEISATILKLGITLSLLQSSLPTPTQQVAILAEQIPNTHNILLINETPLKTQDFNDSGDFKTDIEKILYQFSIAYDVDYDLAHAIAICESQLNPKAKNKSSSASGIFQIIKGTFKQTMKKMGISKADPLDAEDNINIGMWLLANEGSQHWNASRICWSKKLALK